MRDSTERRNRHNVAPPARSGDRRTSLDICNDCFSDDANVGNGALADFSGCQVAAEAVA